MGSGESGPYPCAFGTFLSDSSTVGTKAARGVHRYLCGSTALRRRKRLRLWLCLLLELGVLGWEHWDLETEDRDLAIIGSDQF